MTAHDAYASTKENQKSFKTRRNSFFFFFLPVADAPHVYVRAWTLCCFHSLISTQTFRRALTASMDMQLRGDKECPFTGIISSGRVWRKVPESDVRSVVKGMAGGWGVGGQETDYGMF